jgi:protein-disulfide isomerase
MTNGANTRRDRRAAERQARRERERKPQQGSTFSRHPMAWLSLAAAITGAVLVVSLIAANGLGHGNSDPIQPAYGPAPAASLVHGRSLGASDAPVKIDIWSDFQCPICDQLSWRIEPTLRTTYVVPGTVSVTYHDFAFIGQESVDAAAAARAAEALGASFWAYHDLLFANQGTENGGAFSRDRLAGMAVSLGLDRTAFLQALDDPQYAQAVQAETAQGRALGIQSTPTLFINGKEYAGLPAWSNLSALIDQLAGASPAPSSAASPAGSPVP